MTVVQPFKGIRPRPERVRDVVSGQEDYASLEDARQRGPEKPYSFIHVLWPEIGLPPKISPNDPTVYAHAKANYQKMWDAQVLDMDKMPCFYVYRQQRGGISQTGLVATAAIGDYKHNVIKKHEQTRAQKEQDRVAHIRATGIHAGPVLLFYKALSQIDQLIAEVTNGKPLYDFKTDDGTGHQVWRVEDTHRIHAIRELFESEVPAAYIADGHHRSAAAVKVGEMLRKQYPQAPAEAPHNFFLAMFFPHHEMQIYSYHRLVKDLNGLSKAELMNKLDARFEIRQVEAGPYKPEDMHCFGMYFDGGWYQLQLRELPKVDDPVALLDVRILQQQVLKPLFGIHNPRVDKRLDFGSGRDDIRTLQQKVDQGKMAVAFVLYPVTIEQLMAVADAGKTMPPKSTWVEPKLLSGLLVHRINKL